MHCLKYKFHYRRYEWNSGKMKSTYNLNHDVYWDSEYVVGIFLQISQRAITDSMFEAKYYNFLEEVLSHQNAFRL